MKIESMIENMFDTIQIDKLNMKKIIKIENQTENMQSIMIIDKLNMKKIGKIECYWMIK